MSLSGLGILSVVGIVVVGVVATVGAMAVAWLVAGAVQAGFAVAKWLGRVRTSAKATKGAATATSWVPVVPEDLRLDAATHALLARQAWWRLRC